MPQYLGLHYFLVSCGRIALRAADVGVGGALQKPWRLEHGDHFLHRMAVSGLGCEAALEPCRGHRENSAAVDLDDADAPWRLAGGRGARDPDGPLFRGYTRAVLPRGVRIGHAPWGRRRPFNARAAGGRTSLVQWGSQHVLSR